MAKKQARPAAAVKASMKASPKQPNPFDLKKNKAKFDVLGRRVKGSTKNVVQARVDANTKRKKTLLVEYRQIRKANSFVDKRFGEGAMELSREQRALAKQQAQRQKREAQAMAAQAKGKGKKFALPEGEGSEEGEEGLTLTHRGQALGDMDEFEAPELDELDEDMVADLVRTYNFGGGEEGGPESKGADGRPKTRKQIMEEIIAKSKMYKAMKAKQREEDEAELEQLNNSFKELVRAHALKAMIKPVGYLKGIKVKPDDAGDAAYDTAARLLAQESRAAPGERTLSPEEVAEREATRLQALEKERLRRMRGEGGDDQPGLAPAAASGPVGGYAARRKRLRSSENEEEEEEEEEGGGGGGRGGGGRRRRRKGVREVRRMGA
ncbi:hypothetical protein QJQ45_030150 [Haematococcus lacustris]|nr:hypothetical protein QJQ45_030150 [Haematococcus lacustris]